MKFVETPVFALGFGAAIGAVAWIAPQYIGASRLTQPETLQCTEPHVIQYTFHAKRIERDDNTYIITAKDGTVIRFEKSAYAYCLAVPDKEGG